MLLATSDVDVALNSKVCLNSKMHPKIIIIDTEAKGSTVFKILLPNTVDPIGHGVLRLLSYLEFYSCCYGIEAICLELLGIPLSD